VATSTIQHPPVVEAPRAVRLRAIRELVVERSIGSQRELADALRERGMDVTQATVSRDIAELGLVKVPGAGGHAYVPAESVAAVGPSSDRFLGRLLADIPVRVGRSGLILVLTTGTPGTASSIAQAIDQSSLTEQEGTLAGDNTVLVLFADEARLLRWQARFESLQPGRSASRSRRPVRVPAGRRASNRPVASRPARRAEEVHR
jgi:transcriptional regulator of arginine metabolism